jgi:hypothetical protein
MLCAHTFEAGQRYTTAQLRKENLLLSSIIDDLETLAEAHSLSSQKIELKSQSNVEM